MFGGVGTSGSLVPTITVFRNAPHMNKPRLLTGRVRTTDIQRSVDGSLRQSAFLQILLYVQSIAPFNPLVD
jgi:hypothetical protein